MPTVDWMDDANVLHNFDDNKIPPHTWPGQDFSDYDIVDYVKGYYFGYQKLPDNTYRPRVIIGGWSYIVSSDNRFPVTGDRKTAIMHARDGVIAQYNENKK